MSHVSTVSKALWKKWTVDVHNFKKTRSNCHEFLPSIEARDRTVRKEDEREVMIVGKDTVMVRKRYDRRADIFMWFWCHYDGDCLGHCRPQEWGTRVTKYQFNMPTKTNKTGQSPLCPNDCTIHQSGNRHEE